MFKQGHLEVVKLLIKSGANIELNDDASNSSLYLAVIYSKYITFYFSLSFSYFWFFEFADYKTVLLVTFVLEDYNLLTLGIVTT